MRIENEFTVPAPIEQAWALLTDIPAIAPCLPGAKLTSSEGGVHEGQITVKVGPVTAQYVGTAELTVRDDETHRAEIVAKGRDKRGAGTAQADISAVLAPYGDGTRVSIDTDLRISGKVAQFGRGVMNDVSEKLLGQFATCLEGQLAEPSAEAAEATAAVGTVTTEPVDAPTADVPSVAPTTAAEPAAASAPREDAEPEALDLMDLAGGALARRLVPLAIAIVVIVVLVVILTR